MTFDPKSTAPVLIEYRNDFTTDGGVLHGAVSEVMAKTGMLAHTRDVVAAARSAGAAVMHAPITFASTNLDFILRSKGITTIALGGFLTNCCVESTMRSGYENGYQVITLSDCVAATSVEEHENALKYDYPMFSRPMTADEFIGQLA
jgi:nicotinamidase-related amidase